MPSQGSLLASNLTLGTSRRYHHTRNVSNSSTVAVWLGTSHKEPAIPLLISLMSRYSSKKSPVEFFAHLHWVLQLHRRSHVIWGLWRDQISPWDFDGFWRAHRRSHLWSNGSNFLARYIARLGYTFLSCSLVRWPLIQVSAGRSHWRMWNRKASLWNERAHQSAQVLALNCWSFNSEDVGGLWTWEIERSLSRNSHAHFANFSVEMSF